MWAEGGAVLLPALAGALLAEALGGPQAERWAAELHPWGAFLDRWASIPNPGRLNPLAYNTWLECLYNANHTKRCSAYRRHGLIQTG